MPLPIPLKPIRLWSRWNQDSLAKRQADGERAFARGFQGKAYSDSEKKFPSFQKCCVRGLLARDIAARGFPTFTGVDLSSKTRPGNAIVTVAVDPDTAVRYFVDVKFGAWRSNETCDMITDVDQAHRFQSCFVENNGYQESLIDWAIVQRDRYPWWVRIEATTTTGSTKHSEEVGLPALQIEFERGGWVFPLDEIRGANPTDQTPAGFWARLYHELSFYPLAQTADGVMATWFCRQGIVQNSYLIQSSSSSGQMSGFSSR